MSYKTSFKDGRLGIGLDVNVNSGAPKYPLDINGDIRLTGAILKSDGTTYTSGSGMGTPGIVSNQTDGVYKIGVNNINPTAALDVSGHGLITGDLQLNGTLKDSNGDPRIFSNWDKTGNDITRDSNVTITGDLQLNGTLKDSTGAARIFSNWTLPGGADAGTSHIYRNSQVTIGSSGANGSGYKLYVNGTIATNNGLYHKNYQYYISDTNTRRYWDSNNIYWSCSPSWEMALYNGNLGIGETSPTSKLTIKGGGIFFKQSTHHQGTRPAGPSNGTTTSDFEIASYGAGSWPNDMGFLRLRAGNNGNHTRIDLSAYTPSTGHDCHKNITFYTSGTERMRIKYDGNVTFTGTVTAPTFSGSLSGSSTSCSGTSTYATYANNVHVTNYAITSGNGGSSQEAHTHKLVMIDIGGDGGWKNTGQLGVHNESDGLRYNINSHTLYANYFQGQAYSCTYPNNVHVTNKNGTNATYKMMFCNGSGWQNTGQIMCDDDSSNGPRYNPNVHKIYCNAGEFGDLKSTGNCTFGGVTWDGSPTTWGSLRMGTQASNGGWIGIQMGTNNGKPNWMANTTGNTAGLHWNGTGEWAWYAQQNGGMHIRYNGGERIITTSYGQSLRYRTWINSESNGTCVLCVKSSHSPSDHAVTECHGRSGGWASYTSAYYFHADRRHAYQGWLYMYATSESNTSDESVGLFSSGFWNHGYSFHSSDRRIKEEIEDVPDNKALEMVRNIPCRYYKYKDVTKKRYDSSNNEIKTIGFIAQEVREHFPLSVRIEKNTIIPSIQEIIENFEWEEITDSSNNIKYKLITDEITSDIYNIKYRFHVSNDLSGVGQEEIEVVGESDNTFIFDKKWDNIFCYGYHVDDFHILDKAKLFALNFSATQELDRKVIALEAENLELKDRLKKIEEYLGL